MVLCNIMAFSTTLQDVRERNGRDALWEGNMCIINRIHRSAGGGKALTTGGM